MLILPIKTGRGLNDRGHWRAKAARVKSERQATAWMLTQAVKPALPCTVTLTRLSAGTLDDDGVVGALKACRDQIAEWIDVDDRHRDIVRYVYEQRKCKRGEFGVEVKFGALNVSDLSGIDRA